MEESNTEGQELRQQTGSGGDQEGVHPNLTKEAVVAEVKHILSQRNMQQLEDIIETSRDFQLSKLAKSELRRRRRNERYVIQASKSRKA